MFLSLLLLRALIPYLKLSLLDNPNSRSSHDSPKPRGGGLSFVVISSFSSVFALMNIPFSFATSHVLILAPLIALPLAFVGFLDDRHSLPASFRFAVQLITAVIAIMASSLVTLSPDFLVQAALLLITFTAIVNFIN